MVSSHHPLRPLKPKIKSSINAKKTYRIILSMKRKGEEKRLSKREIFE